MDLKEVMQQQNFVVLGDTVTPDKYAAKIKNGLNAKGYSAVGVGKELSSINDVSGDIDIIDLCIRADKGLELMKANKKPFKCAVVQPGAESPELLKWFGDNGVPYIEGCLLVGMSVYPKQR